MHPLFNAQTLCGVAHFNFKLIYKCLTVKKGTRGHASSATSCSCRNGKRERVHIGSRNGLESNTQKSLQPSCGAPCPIDFSPYVYYCGAVKYFPLCSHGCLRNHECEPMWMTTWKLWTFAVRLLLCGWQPHHTYVLLHWSVWLVGSERKKCMWKIGRKMGEKK